MVGKTADRYPCPNPECDMVYLLEKQKVPWRDNDDFVCDKCGQLVHRWNGGVTFLYRGQEKKAQD